MSKKISRAGAIYAIKQWLEIEEIEKPIRKEVLSILIWKLTEAGYPKYGIPLRTEEAIISKKDKKRQHEHITPRSVLVEQLIKAKSDSEIDDILDSALACVVTKDEHDKLGKEGCWKRYKDKKVYKIINEEKFSIPYEDLASYKKVFGDK